jgi:hypothetical protein
MHRQLPKHDGTRILQLAYTPVRDGGVLLGRFRCVVVQRAKMSLVPVNIELALYCSRDPVENSQRALLLVPLSGRFRCLEHKVHTTVEESHRMFTLVGHIAPDQREDRLRDGERRQFARQVQRMIVRDRIILSLVIRIGLGREFRGRDCIFAFE